MTASEEGEEVKRGVRGVLSRLLQHGQQSDWIRRLRLVEGPDFALAVALALLAVILSLRGSAALGREAYTVADLWFDADLLNRAIVMLDRFAGQHLSNSDHPLFSLAAYLPTWLFRSLFELGPWHSVRATVALVCGIWAAALYVVLRALLRRRVDAALYSLLGLASGSATFWFGAPESFLFGSTTLLLAACVVVMMGERRSRTAMVLVSVLSFSMSVSNWILGLAAAFFRFPWRGAIQVSVNAFFVVTLVWGLSKWFLFPQQEYFLGSSEIAHVAQGETTADPFNHVSASKALRSFAFHTMVIPEIGRRNGQPEAPAEWIGLSLIDSSPGSGTPWGRVACLLWIPMLLLGVVGVLKSKEQTVFASVLMVTIAGNLALHLVFGAETFLYSMHFAPFLVVLAAFGALTRFRIPALVLALGLLVTATVNNQIQFGRAVDMTREIVQEFPTLVRDHVEDDPPRTVVEFLRGSSATPWLISDDSR